MIGYLKGEIINKQKQSVTILCGAVGYEVALTGRQFDTVEKGQDLELFIYTKVREDEISLFGFQSENDLEFFKQLISVNGVGPKTALEILATDSDKVKNAIAQENAAFLSKVPGIGKKTAERIIVELKNKVMPEKFETLNPSLDTQLEEVTAALSNLGYQRSEINRVLKKAPVEITDAEELITYFLKNV